MLFCVVVIEVQWIKREFSEELCVWNAVSAHRSHIGHSIAGDFCKGALESGATRLRHRLGGHQHPWTLRTTTLWDRIPRFCHGMQPLLSTLLVIRIHEQNFSTFPTVLFPFWKQQRTYPYLYLITVVTFYYLVDC